MLGEDDFFEPLERVWQILLKPYDPLLVALGGNGFEVKRTTARRRQWADSLLWSSSGGPRGVEEGARLVGKRLHMKLTRVGMEEYPGIVRKIVLKRSYSGELCASRLRLSAKSNNDCVSGLTFIEEGSISGACSPDRYPNDIASLTAAKYHAMRRWYSSRQVHMHQHSHDDVTLF